MKKLTVESLTLECETILKECKELKVTYKNNPKALVILRKITKRAKDSMKRLKELNLL